MTQEFKFVGLSKPKCITCETSKQDTFRPNTGNLSQERFNALWSLMENNDWSNAKVLVEFDRFSADGVPINSKFIEVTNI